jgi:hypothetical protein
MARPSAEVSLDVVDLRVPIEQHARAGATCVSSADVAIKFLPSRFAGDAERLSRLRIERTAGVLLLLSRISGCRLRISRNTKLLRMECP